MEIPRLNRFMKGVHAMESGEVSASEMAVRGLAHVLDEASKERMGRTTAEVVTEFSIYSKKVNAERSAGQTQGLIVEAVVNTVGE